MNSHAKECETTIEAGRAAQASELASARRLLDELFGPRAERSFAVRFWDGTTDTPPKEQGPAFTLIFRSPSAIRRAFLPPTDRTMGDAFVRGDVDVEGDLEAAAGLAAEIRARRRGPVAFVRLLARAAKLPAGVPQASSSGPRLPNARPTLSGTRHSRARDSAAVRFHYDVGNEFFRVFLDSRLVYSCAYFSRGDETLDEAQEAKLDLICRKLRLREGDRFLDIGCGWGSLVEFAARRYGVDATGITLSPAQAEVARGRIAEAGLDGRCRIELGDYRDLDESKPFRKVASAGMVEHVGRASLPAYFEKVGRLMEPGGLFLNHGIVSLAPTASGLTGLLRRWLAGHTSFIQAFVFPDSELVSPAEVIRPGELVRLELRDVESLREHYATTLRHWMCRLEAGRARAVSEVGEATYRVWRLYMAASAHLFASGQLGIIQALWGKPEADGRLPLPLTRRDLHERA